MKRLTNDELAFVKAFKVKPDDWQDWSFKPARAWDYTEIATWCMHNGVAPYVHDAISAADFLKGIEKKFWDEDGFDGMSLEEVSVWVFVTYYTYEEVRSMSLLQGIRALQDWKYYGGFRKVDDLDVIRAQNAALSVFEGYLIQDPDDDNVSYIIVHEEDE